MFLLQTISLQQRNFKQKIVALLKRFKVSEELDGGVTRGSSSLRGERDLDALFQELESLSCCEGDDSGPDLDSLSIGSTPKPSLRPFFTNSRIMLHDNVAGKRAHKYIYINICILWRYFGLSFWYLIFVFKIIFFCVFFHFYYLKSSNNVLYSIEL